MAKQIYTNCGKCGEGVEIPILDVRKTEACKCGLTEAARSQSEWTMRGMIIGVLVLVIFLGGWLLSNDRLVANAQSELATYKAESERTAQATKTEMEKAAQETKAEAERTNRSGYSYLSTQLDKARKDMSYYKAALGALERKVKLDEKKFVCVRDHAFGGLDIFSYSPCVSCEIVKGKAREMFFVDDPSPVKGEIEKAQKKEEK